MAFTKLNPDEYTQRGGNTAETAAVCLGRDNIQFRLPKSICVRYGFTKTGRVDVLIGSGVDFGMICFMPGGGYSISPQNRAAIDSPWRVACKRGRIPVIRSDISGTTPCDIFAVSGRVYIRLPDEVLDVNSEAA